MRRLMIFAAAALFVAASAIDTASAQRGQRGAGVGVGAGGFQGAAVRGGGMRGVGVHARGPARIGAVRPGGAWASPRGVRGGTVWAGRGLRPGAHGWIRHHRPVWRHRHWDWAFPVAAGFGFLAATAAFASPYGYYDPCWRWTGYEWVNVCYQPYGPYGYYGW